MSGNSPINIDADRLYRLNKTCSKISPLIKIALRAVLLTFFIAMSCVSGRAGAQEAPIEREQARSVISFQSENDLYGDGEDRWYTNGFRLAVALAPQDRPKSFSFVSGLLPSGAKSEDTDLFMAVGQSMFAPADITIKERILDDRPYAGWLYFEAGASGQVGNMQETLTLSVGVTGPPALAERSQKFVHTFTGSPEPQGWEFQIDTEPTLQIFYERAWFYDVANLFGPVSMDVSPRFGANLGSVFIDANAGVIGRIGNFLPHAFPPRINPSATGTGKILRAKKTGVGWYIFGGFETRAVARNMFLDGGIFDNGHTVAKRQFVNEISAGIALSYDRFALSYSYVHRSREFELQSEAQAFGSINLSIAF